jgi:predicted flap endonuclease-1-like 5' DNA nuclease
VLDLVQANLVLVIVLALAVLLAAWWLFAATRKTRVRLTTPDDGDGLARRNQALIDAAPAAVAKSAQPAPPPPAAASDLALIKGLGPKLQAQLAGMGVTSFAQIAAWDDAEIDRIDAQLGRFAGRIRRDNWVEQARLLGAGDTAGFAAKFGKG